MVRGRHVSLYGHWVSELLTTTQAAKTIGVSGRTLARYAKRGLLAPEVVLPSGQYRWDRDKLAAQLDQLRRAHRES